jgi:putative spermidine/putrescine transport system substrate-binding protein
MNRRQFVKTVAAGGAAAVAFPAVIRGARAAGNELVFVGFGGTYQEGQTKAYFEPFERETGIKVIQTTGVDLAKLKAQVQSKRVEWDLVPLPNRLLYTAVRDDLIAPINYNIVNAKDVVPELVSERSVGHIVIAMGLSYGVNAFAGKPVPQTWTDFWDPKKFPGPRGMYNFPGITMEIALIADGVPMDKLYPIDVPRALKSLDRIKADVKVWWSQFPQPGVLLKSGEVSMTPWTRTISEMLAGQPFGFSYQGACFYYEAWTVAKGAPNAENAMKFINYAIQANRQADLVKYAGAAFAPTNGKALPLIDPKLRPLLASHPDNLKQGFLLNGNWWGPNLDKVQEQFNEWRLR